MFIILNTRRLPIKRILVWVCLGLLIIILGLASLLVIKYLNTSETYIPKGIKIEGIPFGGLNREEARTKLLEMSKMVARWPKDPKFELEGFKEGEEGRFLAVNQTLEKIHKAPINSNVNPIYYNILPNYSVNDFDKIKFGKGTDKEFHYLTEEELMELENASNNLFNTVLYPGETFSFDDFWQSINDKKDDLNSKIANLVVRALYNTVKKANLEIVEEWVINKPKLGSLYQNNIEFQPGMDFKFRNNSKSPILIRGEIDQESLKLWILSS